MVKQGVFKQFEAVSGEVEGNFEIDFLGTKMRHEFKAGFCRPEAITVQDYYPAFDEEYFEWIDLLESVVAASGSYTMIDLGAGYGRWGVRAAPSLESHG